MFTTIALGLHVYIQKLLAKKYGCNTIIDLWRLKRIKFRKELKSKVPIGIILAVLVYILSRGQIFFAAITSLNITIKKAYRIGKKFTHLTNFESAKIAVVGPLINILLALLASPFNIPLIKPFITINVAIAISYMLPFPGIDGGTIFFGSKPLYVASAIFIGVIALIMNFLSGIATLIIATIFAIAALISYLYCESK